MRAITVTADDQSKTYGDADPALTYQITTGSLVGSDSFTGAISRVAGENVGTYAIEQGTLALSSNYNLTFVRAPSPSPCADITVTADDQSKTYGDADPALTYQITLARWWAATASPVPSAVWPARTWAPMTSSRALWP